MPIELRCHEQGRVEMIETTRRDPGDGEVRLRVDRCGICGSDLHWFSGSMSPPHVCPGHEISATVAAVGRGVDGWREGDSVAVEPLERCGECAPCLAGSYHLCSRLGIVGVTRDGGMASELVVPAYTLFALPAGVDAELGALTEPLAVAVHAVRLAGSVRDSSVLVLGGGTIGQMAVAAARRLGAAHIAITARHPHQRELAGALGADQVLDPDRVRDCARRPDVVIETVGGSATTIADAIRAVARGGTVVMVGLFDKPPAFDPMAMLIKEVRLVGSNVYNRPTGEAADFEIALEILVDRATALHGVVTHVVPLARAQEAFETAGDKTTGAVKVLLDTTTG